MQLDDSFWAGLGMALGGGLFLWWINRIDRSENKPDAKPATTTKTATGAPPSSPIPPPTDAGPRAT